VVAAREKHTRVRKAATGWTIRMDDKEERAPAGSEKSLFSLLPKSVCESVEIMSVPESKDYSGPFEGLSGKPQFCTRSQLFSRGAMDRTKCTCRIANFYTATRGSFAVPKNPEVNATEGCERYAFNNGSGYNR
jgi:hypothetical protein